MQSQTETDIDTLARTCWAEARGEGYRGMQAVANVVLNRFYLSDQHPHFGHGTIASTCTAPWQFSSWNHSDPNLAELKQVDNSDSFFAMALQIAADAVNGILTDITDAATYYYAKGTATPAWAVGKNPCQTIGNHIFFKNIA